MVSRSSSRWRWIRLLRDALLLTAVAAGARFPAAAYEIPTMAAADPAVDGEALYLEVTLNQTRNGQLFRFVRRDERFFASTDTLRQLGFNVHDNDENRLHALDEFPGVVVRYDPGQQRTLAGLRPVRLTGRVANRAALLKQNFPASRITTCRGRVRPSGCDGNDGVNESRS